MNWDAIGAIGQMFGSLAVLVTLGYVAIQVRDAKQELRRSLSQARSEALRDLLEQVREPRLNSVMTKANDAEGANFLNEFVSYAMEHWQLSRDDAGLLWNLLYSWWQYRLQVIPYVHELSEIERFEFERSTRVLFGIPGAQRVFYELWVKPASHPKVIAYIEGLLSRPA